MYIVSLLRDILSSIKCLVLEINYGMRKSEHKECVMQLVCPEMATEEGKTTNARRIMTEGSWLRFDRSIS